MEDLGSKGISMAVQGMLWTWVFIKGGKTVLETLILQKQLKNNIENLSNVKLDLSTIQGR